MTKQAAVRMYDALKVLTTVFGSLKDNVADVGNGNMTPGEARKCTVATQYCNADNAYDLSMAYSQEWLDVINKANRPWPCRR